MIETHNLRKTFKSRKGAVEAVAGVDLDVRKGEIFGFLGPNGAGKTTTLRMLSTLLPPTSGEATVAGFDLLHDPAKVRYEIGYVSQEGSSAPEIPGRDRAGHSGPPLRHDQGASPAAGRRAHHRARARRLRGPADKDLFGRTETPPRHRHRPHAPAPAAVPRRADHGARSAEQGSDVGRGAQAARHRNDRLPHDPLPRGSRRALRPHRDHRPRQDRRPRHTRRAEAPGRRRRGHRGHRQRERPRAPAAARPAVRPRSHRRETASCASTSTGARPRCRRSFARSTPRASRSRRCR